MNPELTSEQRLAVLNVIININQFLHFTMLSSNFYAIGYNKDADYYITFENVYDILQTYWI